MNPLLMMPALVEGQIILEEAVLTTVDMDLQVHAPTHVIDAVWKALEEYRLKLRYDLVSMFNQSKKYSIEDDVFLGGEIARVASVQFRMMEAGYEGKPGW